MIWKCPFCEHDTTKVLDGTNTKLCTYCFAKWE